MAPLSSSQRCDNAAERIHERLGLWPREIFTSRSRLPSSTAFPLRSRPDLNPPEWSVGLLESLSALVYRFDLQQAQSGPSPSTPHATASQVPVNKYLLADRLSQDLIEAVETRIMLQTRTTRQGSASVTHTPAKPYLTTKDVKTVRAKYSVEEQEEQNQIVVGEESSVEEEVRESLDQYTWEEEGGAGTDDPDSEGSDYSNNSEESLGPSETIISSHADKTNSQDQSMASGDLARKASFSTPFNEVSTATPAAKAATSATVNQDSGIVKDVSVNGARQSQPSSSALPEAPTRGPAPLQLTTLEAVRRHESPRHTHPASCSQSSFVPNKRPRLSSHSSGHSESADQPGSSNAQAYLVNNNNSVNTQDLDMFSEINFIQQHLRLGGSPSSILDNEALSAMAAIRRQSIRFEMSAAYLKAMISHQRALNAADKKVIAKAEKSSDNISGSLESILRQLSEAEGDIEHMASAQETIRHSMDCIPKIDATRVHSDVLRILFHGQKNELDQRQERIADMKIHLATLQDQWRYSEQERALATDRYERGVKALVASVAQQETAIKMKRYWDLVAIAVKLGPEKLPRVMGSQSVAAEDLLEAQVGLEQDGQEITL